MEINTKAFAEQWKEELKKELSVMSSHPGLLIIIAKDYSEPSKVYVNNKLKTGKELGIETFLYEIEWENKSKQELIAEIKNAINKYPSYAAIVQLPFPQITEEDLDAIIPADRDVDGFTNIQKGRLMSGNENALIPCTALGVIKLLKHIHGDLTGKTIAIVNRSNLIGKPLLHLALQNNMTPTIIHTKTDSFDAAVAIETSDIVVTGCGQRKIFNNRDFHPGFTETIIDCSMHKQDGVPGVGDCDKEMILDYLPDVNIASGYGHTGPLTVLALFENVIKSHKTRNTVTQNMNKSDKEFLKALKKEMIEQDKCYQAAPRYWSIIQKERIYGVDSNFHTDGDLIVYDDIEMYTLKDVYEFLLENDYDCCFDKVTFDSNCISIRSKNNNIKEDIYCLESACSFLEYHIGGFEYMHYTDEDSIVSNTMFLTLRECEEHLKANYYHYNKTARPYAMTAWRSPQVERLLKIIEETDWN